jgi:hypothetical protein
MTAWLCGKYPRYAQFPQLGPQTGAGTWRLTHAQHERHDGLCRIWQNWYNGCMNPGSVRRRARSEKFFLIAFQSPVTDKMQAERGEQRFREKESSDA